MSLPHRKHIKDLFEGLLGRDVAIGDSSPVTFDIPRPVVATYVDDAHRLTTVVVMDQALAAYAGAALALLPRGAAEDAVESQLLPPNLFDNSAEILNVLAAPIGEASGVHQRLLETYAPSDPVPPQVQAHGATLGSREDVEVDISGYGRGGLSVVVLHG